MKTPRVTSKVAVLIIALFMTTFYGEAAKSRRAPRTYDLTSRWTWNGTTESGIPPFIVEMIGLRPEGEITYLTCEDSGTMDLVQTGYTFEGTATQTLSCVTRGGQGPFSPPAFPPTFTVTNGFISGKYTSFDFGTCSFAAKVGGSGTKLRGEGVCELPLPAPYFLILTNWKARR